MSTRTIVVGVDDSDTAQFAARRAAQLAAFAQADLHVLSSYRHFATDTAATGDLSVAQTSVEDVERVVAGAVARLRADFPELTIISTPAEGKPAEALVRHAERIGADLIVVGNKRAQGLSRVLGSVAHDVTAHAGCDVYVVHTHAR